MSYQDEYQASINDPAAFWAGKAKDLEWFREPEQVLTQDEHVFIAGLPMAK